MFEEAVCPGDKVWVYAQVSDESGLGKVEIWARYPAGSGDWVPAEMWAVDDQTYQHPLTAHEEPGTEFFIYAEDVHGNSTKSDVQVYAVSPCPVIGDIWIQEPLGPDPVCPGDKVWVYAQVSDVSGLRVEIWTRYPAGSGDWTSEEMSAFDDQTYWHRLTAQEEPGTEFFIYAENEYGNSAMSDVQVYAVEPCAAILMAPDTDRPREG
jgi:hypothetical protein